MTADWVASGWWSHHRLMSLAVVVLHVAGLEVY
jgi:hypothetical protein